MGLDDLTTLGQLFDRIIEGHLGRVAKLGWWLFGGAVSVLLAVVAGTITVVGFVSETKVGVQDCQKALLIQRAQIDTLSHDQRALELLVQRHDAKLENRN